MAMQAARAPEGFDAKDVRLLAELDANARTPLTRLARRAGLSPQAASYRMAQLERRGAIRGYVTFFDMAKLGRMAYRLYVRLEDTAPGEEKSIIDYLRASRDVVWLVSTAGRWDLEVLFAARNSVHFNSMLRKAYERFPGKLHNNVASVSIANYHQPRGYLHGARAAQASYGGEPSQPALDGKDKSIIKLISQGARLNSSQVGSRIGLNYKAVQARIKRMETAGLIRGYRMQLDCAKLGRTAHKAMFKLKRFSDEEEKKALAFCRSSRDIVYMVTCAWPWDLEIEAECADQTEFLGIVRSFRELMGGLVTDYDILAITEEHKLDYCPFAAEL